MNTLAIEYQNKVIENIYMMLCGVTKKTGWTLKSTSGRISKKNFIRHISINDSESGWMNVRYTGLNVESFNRITVETKGFEITANVRKDSEMHSFMVDFFMEFCSNGGVM